MNRLISTNLDGVTDDALPPRRREGPARLLFVHGNILGFKTVAKMLKRYSDQRDDVDAVHVDLEPQLWIKVAGKSAPVRMMGWDFHAERYALYWKHRLARWFRGPLDPSRFDAVHVMTQTNAGSLIGLRKRYPDLPLAVNVDSTARAEIRDFGFSPVAKAWYARYERRLFDAVDLVVTRNAWAPVSLERDYGLPEEKIHVASNSIDVPEDHRWDGRGRDHDGPPRIVFVGTWNRKGGDLLLRVHQQRFRDRAELHVFSKNARVDRSAKNVVWHGFVPREKLVGELLPSMDLFVLPSKDDMLPWAALEASAQGLPVVASRVGAIPQLVADGETGLLCEPGDVEDLARKIEQMLDDAPVRRRMGEAGRRRVQENHDPDRTYPAMIDRLVRLADGGA